MIKPVADPTLEQNFQSLRNEIVRLRKELESRPTATVVGQNLTRVVQTVSRSLRPVASDSYVGAEHDHEDASGGGTLDEDALVLSDVTTNDVDTSAHGFCPKAPNDATKFLDGVAAWDTVKDSDLSLSDIVTNDVDTSAHGFCPKAPNDATKFLDGVAAWDSVKDSDLSLSDIVTNDVSTSAHGFAPKAPNDGTNFLDGLGAWDTVKDSDLSTSDITTNDVDATKHGFCPKATGDFEDRLKGDGTWSDTYVPASITVNTGTDPGGQSVTDIQTMSDGNLYTVAETAGAPGFDIEFGFTSVTAFDTILLRWRYQGSVSHWCGFDIYNYDDSAWEQLSLARHTDAYYEVYTVKGINDADYISGGAVTLRVYHYTGGNNAHDVWIDYVALM